MIEKGVLNIFHFKMTSLILRLRYFYVTDLNDFLSSCHYSAIIVHHLGMFFFMNLQSYAQERFIYC